MAVVRLRDLKGLSVEAKQRIRAALLASGETHSFADNVIESDRTPSKMRNIKTQVDGIWFDSQREAERYVELKFELQAGAIANLKLQKRFRLDVNDVHIADYIADFVYERDGSVIVEDVKSKPTKTRVYRVKKKLMRAIHGIEIREIF